MAVFSAWGFTASQFTGKILSPFFLGKRSVVENPLNPRLRVGLTYIQDKGLPLIFILCGSIGKYNFVFL